MHADEANQAVKLGRLIEQGDYRYDPKDHHGPTLYYFAQLSAWLSGKSSMAELTETSVRLTPAIFGTLALLLLWLIASPFGPGPALVAVLFLALSPPAVYYSRYFIQETLLVTFTLLAWWSGGNWLRSGKCSWAMMGGLGVGLMLATKASALILIGLSVVAVIVAGRGRQLRHQLSDKRATAGAGLAALLVAGIFYSSFGQNWSGLTDALATFSLMGTKALVGTSGHEKPWWYYGSLFFYQRTGGYVWDQTFFLLVAVTGGFVAWRRGSVLARFASTYVALLAVALSLTPYKTPWIVVNLVPGLCLLAGALVMHWRGVLGVLVGAAVVAQLGYQTRQAVFLRPADMRNPYAYQHAGPDVLKISTLAATAPAGPIKVIGSEYWPLPWYLRAHAQVGYWHTPPEDCDGSLLIVSADQAEAVQARLRDQYRQSMLGLRPGFVLVVFTRETGLSR